MPPPQRHARLTVDLDALARNLQAIARAAHGAEVAAVLKANGYGLGVGPIARRLWREGTRTFFVARVSEGEALREELGDLAARICVLDGVHDDTVGRLREAGLTPVVSTMEQARAAEVLARAGGVRRIAVQVNTGMNRQGLSPAEAQALAAESARPSAACAIDLVVSHLGSAAEPQDERNPRQLAIFREALAHFPGARASLGASAGAFLGPEYRFDVVRAGISLFGGGPLEQPDERLEAVATLTAPIVDIRTLEAGDRAGYGTVYTASRPTRVAVVGAGYADGMIRAAQGRSFAFHRGRLRRILVINMDLLLFDLEDEAGEVGEPVELLGPHVKLDDVAQAGGTIAHEVLVRISSRAERIYLGE